jgi:cell division protein FtsZ
VLDEKMKDEVKITVIATGFQQLQRKENSVGAAATAIQQSRTASVYTATAERNSAYSVQEVSEPEAVPEEAPEQEWAPARAQAAPAAPTPAPAPAPASSRVESLEAVSANTSYGDDDLDVPAFIRKRQENQ